MTKRKLARFAELETFDNTFTNPLELRGKWHEKYFHNDNPIILELACGKGEYTNGLAQRFPQKNFIGVDRKGARLWAGARFALDQALQNVAFIRIYIETLESFFTKGEIEEIWITFPDPQPRECKARKRLTSPRFLAIYHNLLKPNGIIHLKTDSNLLYDYTREMIGQYDLALLTDIHDIYNQTGTDPLLTIQTTYEKQHLENGRTISYLKFNFGPSFQAKSLTTIPHRRLV